MNAVTYLDYNATAPIRAEAADAAVRALALAGNASSVHRVGRLARRLAEESRADVAAAIGADASQVVFTSGGTEANNLALKGLVAAGAVERLLVSATEHDSVLAAARATGASVTIVPVDGQGIINLERLDELLGADPAPALVALMLANNETGVIQPVAEAARLAHDHGALVHCDAVQAFAKIPLSPADLGTDTLSLSGHKIGGPQGVGALVVRDGLDLEPIVHGGGQEMGRRAGTENISGIAGFAAAARLAGEAVEAMDGISALRDSLESRVISAVPGVRIFGAESPRLPNTSCFAVAGVEADVQVMALDLAAVLVSAGAACSSGKVAPSHVLEAMGASEAEARGAIRVSLGRDSSESDLDRFMVAWTELYMRAVPGDRTSELGRQAV